MIEETNHRDSEAVRPIEMTDRVFENDLLTEQIIGAAIEVHRHFGPGLLEGIYESCICEESVDRIIGIHEAQLLTYMKLTGIKTGLIIDFNCPTISKGLRRMVL